MTTPDEFSHSEQAKALEWDYNDEDMMSIEDFTTEELEAEIKRRTDAAVEEVANSICYNCNQSTDGKYNAYGKKVCQECFIVIGVKDGLIAEKVAVAFQPPSFKLTPNFNVDKMMNWESYSVIDRYVPEEVNSGCTFNGCMKPATNGFRCYDHDY